MEVLLAAPLGAEGSGEVVVTLRRLAAAPIRFQHQADPSAWVGEPDLLFQEPEDSVAGALRQH